MSVVAVEASAAADLEVARRLYVGNIPRTVKKEELENIFGEHGSVEKTEVTTSTLIIIPLDSFSGSNTGT